MAHPGIILDASVAGHISATRQGDRTHPITAGRARAEPAKVTGRSIPSLRVTENLLFVEGTVRSPICRPVDARQRNGSTMQRGGRCPAQNKKAHTPSPEDMRAALPLFLRDCVVAHQPSAFVFKHFQKFYPNSSSIGTCFIARFPRARNCTIAARATAPCQSIKKAAAAYARQSHAAPRSDVSQVL